MVNVWNPREQLAVYVQVDISANRLSPCDRTNQGQPSQSFSAIMLTVLHVVIHVRLTFSYIIQHLA